MNIVDLYQMKSEATIKLLRDITAGTTFYLPLLIKLLLTTHL